jgi:CRP-like cAMP-binding protein
MMLQGRLSIMFPRPTYTPDIGFPLTRLSALAPLDDADRALLQVAARAEHVVPARREILREGQAIKQAMLLMDGWAYRVAFLPDGRRQILHFLVPGDAIGLCRHRDPVATTTIVAQTDVRLCPAPRPRAGQGHEGLAEAYALASAREEAQLLRHITRLGRLTAQERIIDWILETGDRLVRCGLGSRESFPLPITQEMLADLLGLTSVHVNRMLQALKRDNLLWLRGGIARIDRARCLALVDQGSLPSVPSVPFALFD